MGRKEKWVKGAKGEMKEEERGSGEGGKGRVGEGEKGNTLIPSLSLQ